MNFSQNLAMVMVQSTEPFPVDFDNAWKWIGYFQKSDAKKALLNSGFIEGIDFQVLRSVPQNSKGGRPAKKLYLTVDCFKSFGMMAGTEKGKQIRQYFLECEKRVKEIIPAQNAELEKLRLEVALSQSRERLAAATQTLEGICPGLSALAFGKPEAIIEKERPTTVVQDAYGRSITYDGATITELTKRYGFGKGTKANNQCRAWIRSMGITQDQWIEEPAARITYKLPKEMLTILDQQFSQGRGQRQKLLGEMN
ncbi:hypothetical protein D0962_04180 [Leptolyngbyaceae cyanobacterium CCMR0082]|uniref:Uncharacterized protein n=1 Tax=Adonisia turfae CCMR0082 TaxID=2304604 RepID=A0A6M0S0J1_9CYAN|nr:hypothetical protein [Adonisia turfae CCMR0082]